MRYYFLTLFPEVFHAYFRESMMKRAVERGILSYEVMDIREFSENKHRKVDDYPYGGGAGMVMAPAPIVNALKSIPEWEQLPVVYLTPGGKPFEQSDAVSFSKAPGIIFICGHYEGIDQRVIDAYVTYEVSIGDYVLTGGELPALTMADCIARNLSGFLGNEESLSEESFESCLLEYPQYTRPPVFEEMPVPDILLSGNHKAIEDWRQAKAIEKTQRVRPDLYMRYKKQ